MNELLLIKAREITEILNNEEEIMDIVSKAYVAHTAGKSSLPQSVFLRFPNNKLNRIIGLPAYLEDDVNTAGIKWISSFPENIKHGIERASALMILNNIENGHAETILESSIISAKRTAASAAVAAKLIHSNLNETVVGFVGCGRINKEINVFLRKIFKNIKKLVVFDMLPERAEQFINDIKTEGVEAEVASSVEEVLQKAPLVSFATTAGEPYIHDISSFSPNSTILNISLRDFTPKVILGADNIVDDLDHVCRESTSIHLAEQVCGNRDFVRCPIADIITGKEKGRVEGKTAIYSPFGLGVLDLALACYVRKKAKEKGIGLVIEDFLP